MSIEIPGGSGLFPIPNLRPVAQKTEPQPAPKPAAAVEQPTSKAAVENAVRQANELIKPVSQSIEFTLDSDTGKVIVKMVDKETAQVIRQFPSEEMLALTRAMDKLQGLLIQRKA